MWVGECERCGAREANWMGKHSSCMPPKDEYHPYNHFLEPAGFYDDE